MRFFLQIIEAIIMALSLGHHGNEDDIPDNPCH